jgi:hypothetical protein
LSERTLSQGSRAHVLGSLPTDSSTPRGRPRRPSPRMTGSLRGRDNRRSSFSSTCFFIEARRNPCRCDELRRSRVLAWVAAGGVLGCSNPCPASLHRHFILPWFTKRMAVSRISICRLNDVVLTGLCAHGKVTREYFQSRRLMKDLMLSQRHSFPGVGLKAVVPTNSNPPTHQPARPSTP